MEVIMKKLEEIKPYEKNPRKNDEAVEAVANSIKEFGFQQPIVVDKDGIIIAGHTRYKAALQLGLETVPVVTADKLTKEQARAYRLADNKTGELAGWDFVSLDMELSEIESLDMGDFGFSTMHFDTEELDEYFGGADEHGREKTEKKIQCPHCGEWFNA